MKALGGTLLILGLLTALHAMQLENLYHLAGYMLMSLCMVAVGGFMLEGEKR